MVSTEDQERRAGTRMSFGAHLEELRARFLKALLWSILGLVIVFVWHREVMEFVLRPFQTVMTDLNQDPTLKATSPQQAFFSYVKVSFIVGLVVTAPMWIYQVWAFISAGLYSGERRVVSKYVPFCVGLFVLGVTFGYTTLIPFGLRYLLTFGDPTVIQNWIGLKDYLGLFTVLTLVLGVTFQLPVIMVGMARSGVLGPEAFKRKRKWMILIIFIVCAVLTPPDPVTQCLMALPLIGLYELGIYLSWVGMGAARPSLDWGKVRAGLKKPLFVLVVLVVLYQPASNAWRVDRAEGRLFQTDDETRIDVRAFAEDRLNKPVLSAYRAAESGSEAVVVCDTADRAYVFLLRKTRRQAIVVDRSASGPDGVTMTVAFNPAGQSLFDIILVNEIGYSEFVPQMLTDFALGEDAICEALRPILVKLSGAGMDVADDAALQSWRDWYEAHADKVLIQREGN